MRRCQNRTRRFSGYLDSIEISKLKFETVILSGGGDFFKFGISLFSKLRVVQLHGKRSVNWPTDRTRKQRKSSWSSVCDNEISLGVLSDSIRYDSTNSTGFDENGKGGRKVVYVD